MPKMRWVLLYRFCSKFHTLSSSENWLGFDKVTESLKVGTFFETQCILGNNLVLMPCML